MRAYKYMSVEYADWFAAGSILVGTFESYATIEGARRDRTEGILEHRIDHLFMRDSDTDPRNALLGRYGITSIGNKDCTFASMRRQSCFPPAFCFCMGMDSDNKNLESYEDTAVFEIREPDCLASILERRFSKIINGYRSGCVSYSSRSVDELIHPDATPNPLEKDIKYAPEREYRILWRPLDGVYPGSFVTLPDRAMASLLRRIR